MFIATMYSYGKDAACVGVDGIVTCMGVFLSFKGMLYAIHIPDNKAEVNALGRDTFVAFVKREAPKLDGSAAKLFGVANNRCRQTAEEELKRIGKDLKVDYVVMTRLEEHLGDKKNPVAAAVVCEYFAGGRGPVMKYRQASDAGWTEGGATSRTGWYRQDSQDKVLSTATTNVSDGWHLVNAENSSMKLL